MREKTKQAVCLAGTAAAAGAFLYWSDKKLQTTYYRFVSARLPEAFDGLRIVQISDLQSTWFGRGQCRLARAVERCRPDCIVVTGDLVDRNHTDETAALAAIERLTSMAPVYYCNGNHEMSLSPLYASQIYDRMRDLGVELLLDRTALITRGAARLHWVGLAEETLEAAKTAVQRQPGRPSRRTDTAYSPAVIRSSLNDLTAGVSPGDFTILLAHEPQFLEAYATAEKARIDLIFSGHAHGGQIRLPRTEGLFAPGQGLLPKLTSGLHACGMSTMVISRGLGNSVFPFRIGNRPEIVVCELRTQQGAVKREKVQI